MATSTYEDTRAQPDRADRKPSRRRVVTWFVIVALLLGLVGGGIYGFDRFRSKAIADFFASQVPPPTPVAAEPARQGPMPRYLDGIGTLSAGVTEDRRTGERTVLLRADGNVTGDLARGILRGRLRAVDSASAAIVFGRDGRPRELVVSGVGELDRGLGGTLGLGRAAVQRVSGGRAEVDAHLDLTDAANLSAVRRVTAGLAVDPPTTPGAWARAAPALAALAGLVDADGRIDVRTYASTGTSAGAGADAGVGGRYGAEASVSEDDLHLLQAWSRPPGGLWDTRLDCTRAAGRGG